MNHASPPLHVPPDKLTISNLPKDISVKLGDMACESGLRLRDLGLLALRHGIMYLETNGTVPAGGQRIAESVQ